jgi:hypothetical protein
MLTDNTVDYRNVLFGILVSDVNPGIVPDN